jgi:DNA-binding transcriptional MerR regulator
MFTVNAMTGLRISQLAQTTGFPTATLRCHETIRLLAPERDPNGQGRYGGADVDRQRFVGWAKQLNLRLAEIAALIHYAGITVASTAADNSR